MDKIQQQYLADKVFQTLDFTYHGTIEVCEKDGVYVQYKDGKAHIGASSKIFFARGLMLLAKNLIEGKTDFEITQKPSFKTCGGMLDMSRNAVMKVSSVKKYLDIMACLGLNMLMLYTEDTYKIEDYPYFGYRRGAYSVQELKELDEYADSLGIELIPCIQTLGHLEQYLRWPVTNEIHDTAGVMLCGEEKTYQFVESMVKTLRGAFRTNRIHIGMDEAHGVGLGNYLVKNGYRNRFDILNEHLDKVIKICKKYEFSPMMWSDMFFRLGSKTNDYYDQERDMPEDKIAAIPNVDMVYWDYYHTNYEEFDMFIKAHQEMGKHTVFAGGIWSWCGMLPNIEFTFRTMIPGLKACCNNGIDEVFTTMWGDDGAETNHFFTLSGLPVFSEYNYYGKDCDLEEIKSVMKFVTKFSYEEAMALSQFHAPFVREKTEETGEAMYDYIGKKIFWSDILYNMTERADLIEYKQNFENGYKVLRKSVLQNETWKDYFEYAKTIFEINIEKCDVIQNIQKAYQNKDKMFFGNLFQNTIPYLIEKYKKMLQIHEKQWMGTNKVFGWEVISARYGATITRLEYVQRIAKDYANGTLDSIEELEFEFLESEKFGSSNYRSLVSTSLIW